MSTQNFENVYNEPGWKNFPTIPELKNKTVFITGGGSGIGAFFTAAFAAQGANVGFVSLNKERATKLCDIVEEKTNNRPLDIQADICNIEALRDAITQVADNFGQITILINNAARDTRHTLDNYTVDEWDTSIATNLRPHFFAIQAVAPGMRASGGGSIINVGSNSFNLGLTGYPTYVTAKAAIIGMTKALARELGPDNIRVNALIPGWVLTERQKRLWVNDEALKECLDAQAIKSTLNGWDMVGPALFLASDASSKMTNQELIIDGGRA